jgi:hypothetical protein
MKTEGEYIVVLLYLCITEISKEAFQLKEIVIQRIQTVN